MVKLLNSGNTISGLFGIAVFAVGILNLVLVHPIPGVVYLLLSSLYFPPINNIFRNRFGFSIPPIVRIFLALFLVMFTLGVSDLGDIID